MRRNLPQTGIFLALKSFTTGAKLSSHKHSNRERIGKMRALKLIVMAILVTCFISFCYVACSSSGDGGGGGGGDDTTNTPAEIDEDTVNKAIAFVDDVLPFCSLDNTGSGTMTAIISAVDLAKDYNDQVKLHQASSQRLQPLGAEDDMILNGTCEGAEGTLTISLNENESTGEIVGSAVFDDLCLEIDGDDETTQLTVAGTIEVSGSTDDDSTELNFSTATGGITLTDGETDYSIELDEAEISLTQNDDGIILGFTLNELVFEESSPGATETYTLQDVSVELEISELGNDETQITLTIESMTLQEETEDGTTTYSLDDVEIVVSDTASGTQVSLSGTYIDSEEGAVTISTPTPIEINDEGVITAGTIIIAGSNGTEVMITVSGDNTFDIQADTDGDGTYDYEPGELDCSDFDADSLL